jgi:hypothetical protein
MIFISVIGFSQEQLKKEVHVVKRYQPAVSDAYKLSDLPDINDTVTIEARIGYDIQPKEIPVKYQVRDIKAAKMLGEPISELYRHYLKLGLGNYLTPLAEYRYTSLRDREYQLGVHLYQKSSFGNVKFNDDLKSFAGYHNSKVNIFGKRMWNNLVWDGGLKLTNNANHFYGFNPADTILTKDAIKNEHDQNVMNVSIATAVYSTYIDENKINFGLKTTFDHTNDAYSYNENHFLIKGKASKYFDINKVGLLSSYKKYYRKDTNDHSLFTLNPTLERHEEVWSITAGINVNANKVGNSTDYYYYPRGRLEFNVIRHFVKPYIGVGGGLEINNYYKILQENPFIKPGVFVRDSDHQLEMFGGIKGKISPKVSYDFWMKYAVIDNLYLFVNDYALNDVGNRFDVVYDEAEMTNYSFEVKYNESKWLDFYLKGGFYEYKLIEEEKAWHKPDYRWVFAARYNLQNKIILNGEIIGIGTRYVKPAALNASPIKLNSTTDINIGLEYRYTKVLSGYLKLNNLFSSQYYKWHLYPTQQFNLMLGITIAF